MARRPSAFLDKLVGRLERLDPESLQAQFVHIARERGLLETVFQSIQEGVLVLSGDATLRYANSAAERMLGIDAGRLRGRSVASLFPDVDWEQLLRRDEEEWQRLSSSEMEILQPARRILSVYAVPLESEGEGGVGSGALIMLRDITGDRAQAAEQLESERLNAIQGLASTVAHEIGNPLSSVFNLLSLLERDLRKSGQATEQTFQDLRDARNEVSRIDQILRQFLDAMRPVAPVFAKANIAGVVKETLDVMRPELEDRRVQVLVNCPENLPPVYIDAGQFKQVFFNIFRNALQAMPGGGRLAIGFEADDRNVVVSIRDTGTGIPEAEFRRIFEPYHTTKKKGNGIGLMVVQRIVRDHGGLVEVASKPGEGTVFRIIIPLADRRARLLAQG